METLVNRYRCDIKNNGVNDLLTCIIQDDRPTISSIVTSIYYGFMYAKGRYTIHIGSSYVVLVRLCDAEFTSFAKCRRLLKIDMCYSRIHCLNKPYYQQNSVRRMTRLPTRVLELGVSCTLIYTVPIGFFKTLLISGIKSKTQQRIRESIIRLDQRIIEAPLMHGSIVRALGKKGVPFIPKSTIYLAMPIYVSSIRLKQLKMKGILVRSNVYRVRKE